MLKNEEELQSRIDQFLQRKTAQHPDIGRELEQPDTHDKHPTSPAASFSNARLVR